MKKPVFIGLMCLSLCLLSDAGSAFSEAAEAKNKPRDQFEEGMALWQAGDRKAALAAFEASSESTAYASGAPSAFLFESKGRPSLQGAREDFGRVLLGPPDPAEGHYFLGNVAMGRHLWKESVDHYQQAITLNSNHAFAQFNLALQLARVGHWDSAIGPARKAIDLLPSDPDAHLLLTTGLLEIGTTKALREALEAAQYGVRLLPGNAALRFKLGYVLLRFGRRDEAAKEFRIFLSLADQDTSRKHSVEYAKRLLEEMAPYLLP